MALEEIFDTPLRAAALGMLLVAVVVLIRGLITGRRHRDDVLVLAGLALGLVLLSEWIS